MSAPATQIGKGLWQWELGAYPERIALSHDQTQAAVALGDGRLARFNLPSGEAVFTQAHQGSTLGVLAHPGAGFITAGDDGRLCVVAEDGQVREIFRQEGLWLEPMAQSPDKSLVAVGAGKNVVLADMVSGVMRTLGPHAGVVSGLAVSPGGGVLAVSYTGGVTLWDLGGADEPANIRWSGANHALAFSPNGAYLACAHQENAVHVLDLERQEVFGLTGLPGKASQMAWSADSRYLMTTGSRAILCWPVPDCFTENPTPVAFAVQEEARMTAVAANPAIPFAAAGFSDGRILLAELNRFAALDLDHLPTSPVSALAFSARGLNLVCALEDGRALALDLGQLLSGD